MPINYRELLSVVEDLCENQQIIVTVEESITGGIIAGVSTVVGGLLLGPRGLAFGGIFGGITAALLSQNKFKSLAEVIKEDLTPRQRQSLANRIEHALRDFQIQDLAILLPLLMSNRNIQQAVIRTVISFLEREMGMRVMEIETS